MAANLRPARLDQDFGPMITPDQFKSFHAERWPRLKLAIPLVTSLATHGRANLLEKARSLATQRVGEEGEDGLVTLMTTTDDIIQFCRAQIEILEAVQTRLMVVADDLLIELGEPSAMTEKLFDPEDWIKRATDAGLTMFVRDNELWLGSVAEMGRSAVIERLRAELDDDNRDAVRTILASRGLECGES